MIDTVTKIFGGTSFAKTILVDDHGLDTYFSQSGTHAEDNFIQANTNRLSRIKKLWINNTPCPACAKLLIKAYANTASKPTIYAAHFYGGSSANHSLQCLAKMIKEGFRIMPICWKVFKRRMTDQGCKNDIDKALRDNKFVKKMKTLKETIAKAKSITQPNC